MIIGGYDESENDRGKNREEFFLGTKKGNISLN